MEDHLGRLLHSWEHVHHIDRNTHNNAISNLKVLSDEEHIRSHGCRESNKGAASTSKYRGVCWQKANGKWRAKIQFNKRTLHLGLFAEEIEAAKAYDVKAKELFGEFAALNF